MFFDEKKESFSSTYKKLNEHIVNLFMQNCEILKEGKYVLKRQEGQGSYHNTKDFDKFTGGEGVEWDKNISEYKLNLRER